MKDTQIVAALIAALIAILAMSMEVCADITGTSVEEQLYVALHTSDIATAEEVAAAQQAALEDAMLEAALAAADVNKPAAEPVTYEDLFRQNGNRIDDCRITHYCCEPYAHICGDGDGLTATEVPVTPYWTCAVDPSVIPYGAEVMVDYGDSVAFYKAQDCGSGVDGRHIDLAVETHAEADQLGVKYATVYWCKEE